MASGATSLIIWFGGNRIIAGELTAGQLAQFIFYLQLLTGPVQGIGVIVSNFARAISAGRRLFEILDATPSVKEPDDPVVS